ncbi:Uncharacterised protein [Yersinia enterocolitica]|nr:Uncharacterised protein [Yersinia enterocolitica]
MTTITSAQANKLMQVALFTAANRNRSFVNVLTEQQEAPKSVNPDKKGTTQTSHNAPVVRITDLQKQKGDEVDMQIVHKLSKRPTMGDEKLAGRGENLAFADFALKINQGRHLVDAGGKMSEQRFKHNLNKTARTLLGTYFNDVQDQSATFHLAGARGDYMADDTIVPLADHGEFGKIMINDVLPPTYDRHFYSGDATSMETLDAADLFTLATVDNIALFLDEMAHPLQPIRMSKDELANEDPYFVLYVTPRQWNDWYTSTSGKDWQAMMTRAVQRSKGFDHPLFKGECAMWRNVLVRKYGGTPVRFNTGSKVLVSNNDLAASTKIITTGTTIDRAMLLGGQALANAYGTGDGGGFFGYNEEKVDHGNGTEVSIRWINGLKKIRFKQKDGRVNDHGVMVVDSAVTLGKYIPVIQQAGFGLLSFCLEKNVMTIIKAPSIGDAVYQGPQGNLSLAEGQIILKDAAVGDVIEFLELPIGMRIYGVSVVSEALGAGVTVEVKSGTTTLVAAASHTAAVAKNVPIVPYSTQTADEKVTAVIAGGAANGRLVVNILYVAVGY